MTIKWVSCIAVRDGSILLAKLRNKNPLIVRLQWTFPFVPLQEGESPRIAVQRLFESIKLNVNVGKFLVKFVPSENPKIEQMFYDVNCKRGFPQPSDQFSQFVWIRPMQILKYYTTSISSDVMDYLRSLDKTGKGAIIQ
jgi:hypothetical protein